MDDRSVAGVVRQRIRSLRHAAGLSLDELGQRCAMSASSLSRIETGKRGIDLDALVGLARGLQVSIDTLLEPDTHDDVVIRPVPRNGPGVTTWELSRPTGSTVAVKQRLDPSRPVGDLKVHPGYDWFFVLSGTIRLSLGERVLLVHAGEAAEFDTMIPHRFEADGGPAEIISLFDRDGQRAHLHTHDG